MVQRCFNPAPPSFLDHFSLPEFSDEEMKQYQEILISPVFQKAILMIQQKKPSSHVIGAGGLTPDTLDEVRRLSEMKGWELYHNRLIMIGITKSKKKAKYVPKTDYQEVTI